MKYKTLPNITSLRFFMAFLVILFHVPQFMANRDWPYYNYLPIFQKGGEAVYVFFCLSGFLIIRNLYLEKKLTGTVSIKNFYIRRILRIFPLYYSVLTFGLIYYNIILPELGLSIGKGKYTILEGVLLGGTFFSNILEVYHPGGILEILWSIGIEEQFYLFIAPIFLLFPIRKMLGFLFLFTIVYFTIFHSDAFKVLRDYRMYFYYFSASGVISILSITYPDFKINKIIKVIVYVLVLIYFITNIFKENFSEFYYNLFSTVLLPIFVFVIAQKPYKLLENRILKYFGKISYGIYMLHPIVIQVVGFLFLNLSIDFLYNNQWFTIIAFNLLTIAVTLLGSHLSYKYFETFFLKYKTVK